MELYDNNNEEFDVNYYASDEEINELDEVNENEEANLKNQIDTCRGLYLRDLGNLKLNDDVDKDLEDVVLNIIPRLNILFDKINVNSKTVTWNSRFLMCDKYDYYKENNLGGEYSQEIDMLYEQFIFKRNRIVSNNLKLVLTLIKKVPVSKILGIDEAISCGNMAIIRAVESFDFQRKCKFSTFLAIVIKDTLYEYYYKEHFLVYKPEHLHFSYRGIYKVRMTFKEKYNRYPTDKEVSEYLNITESKVKYLDSLFKKYVSLDKILLENPDTEEETVRKIGFVDSVEEEYIRNNEINDIYKIIENNLTEREREIVYYKSMGFTNDDIGVFLGITGARVSQLAIRAFSKIKENYFYSDQNIKKQPKKKKRIKRDDK